MMARRTIFAAMLTLIAVLAALLRTQTAAAALWLIFEPSRAVPGATMQARTGGKGAFALVSQPSLPVFLIAKPIADSVTSRDDKRLIPIGNLVVDNQKNGTLSFIVPNIPSGDYESLMHCEECARSSAGRVMLPVGTFQVATALPNTREAPWPTIWSILLSSGLIVVGLGVRRWGTHAAPHQHDAGW